MRLSFLRNAGLGALVLMTTHGAVGAYTLTPMEAQLEPEGRATSGVFRINNTFARPVAITTSVFTREMAEDGSDILTPAPDDFVVFPPQFVVMPGATQSLKVQYVGQNDAVTEKAYRLVVEEVPIPLDDSEADEGGAMTFRVKYSASMYVGEAGLKPAVRVLETAPTETGMLAVTLENSGAAHALLTRVALDVNGLLLQTDEELFGLSGENLLPGVKRVLEIPMPEALEEAETYKAQLKAR